MQAIAIGRFTFETSLVYRVAFTESSVKMYWLIESNVAINPLAHGSTQLELTKAANKRAMTSLVRC